MKTQEKRPNIRITCPCDLYRLAPHFYIVKLGFTGVYGFSYFFALKQRLWALSEAVLTCTHKLRFEQIFENSQNISTENCHFYSQNLCVLYRHVCVMTQIKKAYTVQSKRYALGQSEPKSCPRNQNGEYLKSGIGILQGENTINRVNNSIPIGGHSASIT